MVRAIPLTMFFATWVAALAAFGGVAPGFEWAYPILACLLFLLCWKIEPPKDEGTRSARALAILAVAAVGLVAFQTVPLPEPLLRVVSPLAWFRSFEWLREVAVDPRTAYPLSVDPPATVSSLLKLLGFCALFFSTLLLAPRYPQKQRLAWVFLSLTALVSLVGLVHLFSGSDKVLWTFSKGHTFFGPFVNRNHAGGMIACAALVAFALLFSRTLAGARPWVGAAFLLFLFTLLFIGSRGALLTTLSFCLAHLVLQRDRAHRGMAILLAVSFAGILALSFSWKAKFFDRLRGAQEQRLAFYGQALTLFRSAPLLGSGAGTFSELSPTLAPPTSLLHAEHVENDYLETLSSTGGLGFSVLAAFLVILSIHAARVYANPKIPTPYRAFALAYFGLLFHALFIFHMPLPSQHFLFCILAMGFLRDDLLLSRRWIAPIALGCLGVSVAFALADRQSRIEAHEAGQAFSLPTSLRSASDFRSARGLAAGLTHDVERALARRPYDGSLAFDASKIKFLAGEPEKGSLLADAAIRRTPLAFDRVLDAVDTMIRFGSATRAFELWQERIERHAWIPVRFRAQVGYHLVDAFLSGGDRVRAQETFERLRTVEGTDWRRDFYGYALDPSRPLDLLSSSWREFQAHRTNDPEVWNAAFRRLNLPNAQRMEVLDALAWIKPDVVRLLEPGERARLSTTTAHLHWTESASEMAKTWTLALPLVACRPPLEVRWIARGPGASQALGFVRLESGERIEAKSRARASGGREFWIEKLDQPVHSFETVVPGKNGGINTESIEIFAHFPI